MGTIKKLYQDQLVGGSGSAGQEVYPVTSTLGVYDTDNNQLQGVLNKLTTQVIYDVTLHSGLSFASLSALLSDINLSTLIPTAVRHGGMSIRFVQSSDNSYVQYRYFGTVVTGTPNPFLDATNWKDDNEDLSDTVDEILGTKDIDLDVSSLNWESGGINASTGETTSASTLFWTEVNVKSYSKIKFWSFVTTGNNGYAFFNRAGNYISGGKNPYVDSSSVSKYVTVDVPANAKYIRISNLAEDKTKDISIYGQEGKVTDYCVCLTEQTLSSNQKNVARTNIGAASQQDLQNISDDVEDLNSKINEQEVTVKPYDSQNNLLCENTGYINDDGRPSTVQDYVYTDFIDITGAIEIKVKCLLNNPYHIGGIDFYTAQSFNSWISKIEEISGSEDQTKNSEGTITASMIPSGAKYMVVSCWLNTISGKGDYYVEITKEVEGELLQRINALSEEVIEGVEVTNYALLFSIINGKKYGSDGTLSDDTSYDSTTLVKLDKDKNLYIGVTSSSNGIAQFFDSSKTPISQLTGNAATPIDKSDYPSGAVYVAFSYPLSGIVADRFYVSANPIAVCPSRYSTIVKLKGTRPRIYIHTTDTEAQVCEKMMQAVLTWDCDVIWDFGTYTFTTMWDWMKANWGAFSFRNTYELPIGGNCRYYFNNATIIMNNASTNSSVVSNSNIFGTDRSLDSPYALFDGTLIRQSGGNYCVHDEGQNLDNPYIHEYHNMTMKWEYNNSPSSIGTCIGMGMGKHGEIVVDNCLLFSEQPTASDLAIFKCHGRNDGSSQVVTQFKITIKDCYIGTFIDLGSMNANETCIAHICGNSMGADVEVSSSGAAQYTIYKHGNEIRS